MNYTPNELQNITFKKAMRGYSEQEVNEVLDKIIDDYSAYIHENIELKDRLAVLNEGIQHYKNIEESLQNTLLVAQQTGEDIKKAAYEKAEIIVKEAELKAKMIINEANDEIIKSKRELDDLKKNMRIYKNKVESLLMSQLEMIKDMNLIDNEKKVDNIQVKNVVEERVLSIK
jgi:cell division initiation protein